MNPFLTKIPLTDDFGFLDRKARERNDILFESIIKEKQGSYPGQFEEANEISKLLCNEMDVRIGKAEIIFKDHNFILLFNETLDNRSYGKTFGNEVTITVNPKKVPSCDMVATIAHEIMHVFQQKLEKIDGVNENSMMLYWYSLRFANSTTEMFSQNFFYALYFMYSTERKANISAISSYLAEYFHGKEKITAKDIVSALNEHDAYKRYNEFLWFFKQVKPSSHDIKYITECMTGELKNPFTGKIERMYSPGTFDCNIFIKKNVKQIINLSEDTIKHMHKNAMIFLENVK